MVDIIVNITEFLYNLKCSKFCKEKKKSFENYEIFNKR